jgi:phospholipid/cholesterol/gamma-HCH transport system substrate-binding protein
MRTLGARHLACLGIAAAVLSAGLATVLVAYGRGEFADRYELYATFSSSSQGVFTDGGTDVKLRGVRVGSVRGAELLDDGSVRLVLAIDSGVEVPASTEARLAPLSVFGPKYVELLPGTDDERAPHLRPGAELAATSVLPELTDVLEGAGGLFAAAEPADVLAIIDAVATATGGRGDELGDAIDGASVLADIAAEDQALLGTFLPDLRTIATTVASRNAGFLGRLASYQSLAQLLVDHASDLEATFLTSTRLAERVDQLVLDAAQDFDATVRTAAILLSGIYEDRDLLPAALDTVGAFFDMLGAGMRLPGPDGKNLTALKGFITADLCLVFGVCLLPEGGLTAPAGSAVGTAATGTTVPDRIDLLPLVDALLQPVEAGP